MVRQLASAPAGPNRSVVFYVRIRPEDVSRQMPYQPRPAGYKYPRRRYQVMALSIPPPTGRGA
jgi:hypothetical protein